MIGLAWAEVHPRGTPCLTKHHTARTHECQRAHTHVAISLSTMAFSFSLASCWLVRLAVSSCACRKRAHPITLCFPKWSIFKHSVQATQGMPHKGHQALSGNAGSR